MIAKPNQSSRANARRMSRRLRQTRRPTGSRRAPLRPSLTFGVGPSCHDPLMSEMMTCPVCKSGDHVRRKLVTLPFLITPRAGSPHFVVSAPTESERHFTHASFAGGFFCDACQKAFVPESTLRELRLDENEILSCQSGWSVPFSAYGP